MIGEELVDRVRRARERQGAVIDRVCGACDNKCCKQMTMMGSQDLRRLVKAMLLDPDFQGRVRDGLARVADRLERDLLVLKQVTELLEASSDESQADDLADLRRNVQQWADFVRWLRSDFPLDYDEMRRLLHFSAIRSNTVKAVDRFPGGLGALANLSGPDSGFQYSRRRLGPQRCLFYLDDRGCICEDAKPAKCANFFCVGEPDLLQELRKELSFDDFVMANLNIIDFQTLQEMISLERDLGSEFIAPKIVIGASHEQIDRIAATMGSAGENVRVRRIERPGLRSAAEVERELAEIPEGVGLLEVYPAINGNTLYELALALDRIRLRDEHPSYVLAAGELKPTPAAHPVWDDRMMAQPLGALDLFVIRD
ncbi:MAG: hypothetical protein U9R79_05630 [Armatimonadota bacterium]|nr:hypothetical protein [Armatimonadota bacterium]